MQCEHAGNLTHLISPFVQVALHCISLAFLVVAGSCALLIPVMLYIFQLQTRGWQWPHAALFGSMLASTDAVAIVATMKTSELHYSSACPF